jgi:hypothetical protein
MVRRKRLKASAHPAHWKVSTELRLGRRVLEPGTRCTVRGERGGVFRFVEHVVNPDNGAEWVTLLGGRAGVVTYRSFRPERIARVMRSS